jgi:biotin transport system substrate-specific component
MSSLSLSVGRPVLVDLIPGALIRDAAAVLVGAGVTGLAAQVSIHTSLSPVPFTLQTLAVLTVGAAVGTWRGITSMLLYLVVGMAGVPWFANHSHGIGGPSFGYILGFVAAAGITGFLAKRGADRSILGTVVLMVLGSLAVYAVGTAWLAADLGVGVNTAFDLGTRPFLATDAIKIAVAALAFPAAWRLARSDA